MPRPLRGLIAIAEFGSKFEADAAVALLESAEIDAAPSYDPAMNSAAPYLASDRTFEVLVREADADRAVAVLSRGVGHLPAEYTDAWEAANDAERRARSTVRGCFITAMIVALVVVVAILALTAAH